MKKKKWIPALTTLMCAFALSGYALDSSSLFADLRVGHRSSEQRNYDLDKQRASDMEKAWSRLRSGLDDEHYIRLVFASSSLTGDFRKYEVTSLSAQGTLLTIQLRKLEDEDKKRGLSLRAREVSRLELLERPW
jgi:hypothetical protein